VSDKELKEEYIVPKSLDERVVAIVSRAVSGAAVESGVSELFQQSTALSV